MLGYANYLAALVFVFLPYIILMVEGAALDNQIEFRSLCHLISVAKKVAEGQKQEKRDEVWTPLPSVELQGIIQNVKETALKTDPDLLPLYENYTKNGEPTKPAWRTANPRLTARSVQENLAIKAAVAKIKNIWHKLTDVTDYGRRDSSPPGRQEKTIMGQLTQIESVAAGYRDEAKNAALRALYGKTGQLSTSNGETFADQRQNGAKTNAGLSLANDVVVLCPSESDGQNECVGSDQDNGLTAYAHTGGPTDAKTNWLVLEQNCPPQKGRVTPQTIFLALQNFSSLLGSSLKDDYTLPSSTHKPFRWTLGLRTNSNKNKECGASSSDLCVDYVTVLKGNGIQWKAELELAAEKLDQVLEEHRKAEQLLHHARMMELAAHQAYEGAKATLEHGQEETGKSAQSQNQSQKLNPSTPADKTTAQNPNAINTAIIPSFILPLTLLI